MQRFRKDFIAGTVAGIASITLGHPLDTIKVRMQRSSTPTTMRKCVKDIFSKEGSAGYFKGLLSPVAGNAPVTALIFAGNEFGKVMLHSESQFSKTQQIFIAGCVGGLAGLIAATPVELVKIRGQLNNTEFINYRKEFTYIFKNEGYFGLYRGFQCQVVRDVPPYGLYFLSYEKLQELFSLDSNKPYEELSTNEVFVRINAGGVAGQVVWFSSYPLDVMKSYIQQNDKPLTMRQACKELIKADGMMVFTKGIVPCLIRAYPVNAVCFITYEFVASQLKEKHL